MNIQNLYPSPEDLVRARMQGAAHAGYKVEVDGRAIPCLTMHYNGQDGHVSIVLDGRWEIDVPFEYAERVAWMIANANAIGQGYSHLGAPNKDKPYAPEVRGGNHLIPSAPQEPAR